MKLVVLIPAFNEEKTITETILKIPRKITGIDKVEVLVVNDGSTDNTADMALNGGADKVVTHRVNKGVGAAFMTGVRNAIAMKADILVNIDADLQFDPAYIPEVVSPILSNQYDVVVGTRFFLKLPPSYPKIKEIGNKVFSKMISWASGQKLTDTQSGFRAYSKDALHDISIVNDFTYTQEVLIDLVYKGHRIGEVPVKLEHYRKDSRVVNSIFRYSVRSLSIISKTIIFHRPLFTFGIIGLLLAIGGIAAKLLTTSGVFIVNSSLSTGFIILGAVCFILGIFANIVFKRQIFLEKESRYRSRLHEEKN